MFCASAEINTNAILLANSLKITPKVCKPYLKNGDLCSSDFDCLNSLACANGKCSRYGSLKNFEVSDNKLACESGFNGEIMDDKTGYKMKVCLPTPKIVSN